MSAAQFKFPTQTFTLPDGFVIECVAQPPLIERPLYASFDELGRLYVADSSGSNDKPEKQLEEKPHRIVRLEPAGEDGVFRKSGVFADRMMFPEGCMWHDGSLYVAAPPSIWKLTDTDGDGVADKREEWFQGKTLTGCANDLHGPYLGPDGWIYWCKGAFAKQTYERPGKPPFVTRAAHIFRARPDGTSIEPVITGGMDNPVAVAFTPEGERILCGTFFTTSEPGKRDGLIHAVYGGVYGKVNEVTDEHIKTGDLMPVMTHMGPAAPCSVIRYESRVFGQDYQDNLFVCCFNLHKVTRHVLLPDGATFKTVDSDFLVSDNPDFHPTDVIEDADGSLLVVDTGGWYKLCCPTSQLAKPDVLGAIYRIRRADALKTEDPLGLKIAWQKLKPADLAGLLSDSRVFVQRRAVEELGRLGEAAIPALKELVVSGANAAREHEWPRGAACRQKALWALTRIGSPNASEVVRLGFKDPDETVRLVALQSAALLRDGEAAKALDSAAAGTVRSFASAREERAFDELLGRTGKCDQRLLDRSSFLEHAGAPKDRVLEHSFIYAMIEAHAAQIARNILAQEASPAASSRRRACALIALDQMENGGLTPQMVGPLLAPDTPGELRAAAEWVVRHHPEWGGALVEVLRHRFEADSSWAGLEGQLVVFARAPEVQDLILSSSQPAEPSIPRRCMMLRVMAGARLERPPPNWAESVRASLAETNQTLVRSAIAAAGALGRSRTNAPDFSKGLLNIAESEQWPDDLRLEALEAIPGRLHLPEPGLLNFLTANVDASKPVPVRSAAAGVLARAKLSDAQLQALSTALGTAGPLEVNKMLSTFEQSTNESVGLALMSALKSSKAMASLRPDVLRTLVARYPAPVQHQGAELLAMLNVDAAKQSAHLDQLLPTLKDGDVRRGQAVFNSTKAACASCHRLGYLGGNVGPDLTSIGQARTERDLLESIVYPSASFVRSYEPVIVRTKSDEDYNGILRVDAPSEVVLVTGPNAEVRLLRSEIVEMRPGTVSIMPAGLDEQLSRQELADLLAFLKATRWGPQ